MPFVLSIDSVAALSTVFTATPVNAAVAEAALVSVELLPLHVAPNAKAGRFDRVPVPILVGPGYGDTTVTVCK